MLATIVYLLCAATSFLCSILLFRGYRAAGTRLLFWSALCFLGFALNNLLLLIDATSASVDLLSWRLVPAVLGVGSLIYGMVWESR